MHEDNGAVHTTLALSHLEAGLGTTRAHDVFLDPKINDGDDLRSDARRHPPPGARSDLLSDLLLPGAWHKADATHERLEGHPGNV